MSLQIKTNFLDTPSILGIDIGSVTISLVQMSVDKKIINTAYQFHYGNVYHTFQEMISKFNLGQVIGVASTSAYAHQINADQTIDNKVAIIEATRFQHSQFRSIIVIGGEKFGLLTFDEQGNYLKFIENTSCAAGTGSFLDQQASRLNLKNVMELSAIAASNTGKMPEIATRCAVFAKTDLIHAQQEGYTLPEICDGLCYGLSKNICDTVFKNDVIQDPLILCGGVALNDSVIKHIEGIIHKKLTIDENAHLYGALGAAVFFINSEKIQTTEKRKIAVEKILAPPQNSNKVYYYEPLALATSTYPQFNKTKRYIYHAHTSNIDFQVEVDHYQQKHSTGKISAYLGIDIGSTSTKAVLLDMNNVVMSGFYTRTAGRPLQAVQAIFEAATHLAQESKIELEIIAAGTTGSGRKFIGKIINAAQIIDEITAHARAAVELNPDVDTIIEIGGQDAKFTTLKNGRVTFSIMNTVCAAGTGSFIEEQAKKLGCPLDEFESKTMGIKAPMSSDRCTVFMERDLNHLLNHGYSTNEVLAAVLHSVRENYLTKVASESLIGKTIFFQGATAKNKSLVAAFEQRLGKPLMVSQYCHLTGALGAALTLADLGITSSDFRGLSLYQAKIPVHRGICNICNNNCKITLVEINGEKIDYGLLCGRDYNTNKKMLTEKNPHNFLTPRKSILKELIAPNLKQDRKSHRTLNGKPLTIGIPAALYMYEDLCLWQAFFENLNIRTKVSESYRSAAKSGKQAAQAEFCAPMASMHGHIKELLQTTDYVFSPYYLEKTRDKTIGRKQYCYYSQFIPALVADLDVNAPKKLLTPLLRYLYTGFHRKIQLYKMLKQIPGLDISFFDVASAYEQAMTTQKNYQQELRTCFAKNYHNTDDIQIVLLGRPYIALNPNANNDIPNLIANKGIDVFYQDMLPAHQISSSQISSLLEELPWHYGTNVIKATETILDLKNVYPIYLTAFKCGPDSFVTPIFKKMMDAHQKPYLILELDEHDSNVGYETRIEAGIRSFKNHFQMTKAPTSTQLKHLNPQHVKSMHHKTVIMPCWDYITNTFLAANLRREGYDVILMNETEGSIRRSLKHNNGQCIPVNAVAQGAIETIEKYNLDPSETIIWNSHSELACNIKMYPYYIKTVLQEYGQGMEKVNVYVGEITFIDISLKAAMNAYFAYMLGGLIQAATCKIRPHEMNPGQTDRVVNKSIRILTDAFLGIRDRFEVVQDISHWLQQIPINRQPRPKVAIFGDLYARDNQVMNQDLIRFIEKEGGEVITTPYSEYCKMVAMKYFKKWFTERRYMTVLANRTLLTMMLRIETSYYKCFEPILGTLAEDYNTPPEDILNQYQIAPENTGESMDNILKIYYIKKHHPDVSLFVQTNPAFCCASIVTGAMAKKVEKFTGVPVISVTYDGTGGNKNESIIPYLKYPKKITPIVKKPKSSSDRTSILMAI